MMNKNNALKKFIDEIYLNNSTLVLSNKDIKELNHCFKIVIGNEEKFNCFFKENENKISKLKSGMLEIKKQHKQRKALQPGILTECNYVETLAKIFDLTECIDLENPYYKSIPKDCIQYIEKTTFSSGRYLYHNPKKNIYLFQYGNPDAGDAEIIIDGNKIKLEFKERVAKAGEYDVTGLYNEEGKLLLTESFKKNTPELVPFIEKFNEDTNVIEQVGSNYNKFDEDIKIKSIKEYFLKNNIDVLITSTESNELVALTIDYINAKLKDGTKIISTENSEIRTTGRNPHKIFTNKFFDKILKQMNAEIIGPDKYKVNLNNKLVDLVKGRGTNKITRVKFNKVFFVRISNVEINYDENYVIFNRKDVMQAVPTISMHLTINGSKEELKNYYEIKVEV